MAAVKQEPQQQPAPEAPKMQPQQQPPPVPAHPLDNLQPMLNLVFLQSGRFIKEHQSGGGTGRMKLGMQRAVPVATERFQDSLDQLENEIRNAQIVLRRDLALLKQDRKRKLEAAAKQQEAEKARLAAATKSAEKTAQKDEMQVDKASTPAQPEAVKSERSPEKASAPEPALERKEENVPAPIDTKTEPNEERDPLFDGTPTTANAGDNEFDFDAMFGDAMDMGVDSNTNDMMDTSGDMNFNFDEEPSLLRGLEDFAKASDTDNTAHNATNMDIDMAMSDMPDLTAATNNDTTALAEQPPATTTTTTTTTTKAEETPAQPAQAPAEPAPAAEEESKDETKDEPLDMMVTDNFDDLFNMDEEYSNPEASAFDDAFFDFNT